MTIQATTPGSLRVQIIQDQPSSFCSRITNSLVNCAKKVGLGITVAGALTPISTSLAFLGQKAGLIQETRDRSFELQEAVDNLAKMGLNFDGKALANAACPIKEHVKQWNRLFHNIPEFQQTVFSVKASMFATAGVALPLLEEIAFRGLIQDLLLKRFPKYVVNKVAPGKETCVDSNIAKAARIALTAAAFSTYHLTNKGFFTDSYISMQLVATFGLGIGLGVIKESKSGLQGAIGAHMANNVMAMLPTLMSC